MVRGGEEVVERFVEGIGGVLKNLIKKLPWGIPGGKVPVYPTPISHP